MQEMRACGSVPPDRQLHSFGFTCVHRGYAIEAYGLLTIAPVVLSSSTFE
jgi:hypothetical protein